MKNRKGLANHLITFYEWGSITSCYRDKRGCIIYLSGDKSEIIVDILMDREIICSDDSKNNGIKYYSKTPLLYMMARYLRITKVMLKNNKRARRWFNSMIKNNFHYAGKLFKDYFLPNGEVNWPLFIEKSKVTLPHLERIMLCEGVEWEGYDPLKNCINYQKDN